MHKAQSVITYIMIKKLLFIICLLASSSVLAQGSFPMPNDSVQQFNYNRNRIEHTGMTVLGGWAIANMAAGTIGYYHTTGSSRYFNQMNIIWNIVNLGAATAGFLNSRTDMSNLTPAQSINKQRSLEKTFLINGVLDVVYIGAGVALHHRGDVNNSDRQRGYGSAIILQGAFLLLFDGTMYAAERSNGNRMLRFLLKNQLIFHGKQVGMLINL